MYRLSNTVASRRLLRSRIAIAAIAILTLLGPLPADAQNGPVIAPGLDTSAVNTYPNENYYFGLAQYREGEIANAAMSFDLALGRTRKDPGGRWIDAIPVLAMTAECLYHTGDLAGAVENIDAALAIAVRNRGWLRALAWNDLMSGAVRQPDPAASWAAPQVPAVLPLPNRISIASGEVDLSNTFQRGGVVEGAKLTRMDAIEVMRGIAIALYRRGVIFGEITGEFEVADQTLQAILYPPDFNLPVGRALIGSMRGCGKFAAGETEELASDIAKAASLPGGVHPLTPILLLAGARQAALTDQPAIAVSLSIRAAAAASALGQPEWVGEGLMIAAGCVDSRTAAPLQASASAAAIAHQRRGRFASMGALAAAADAALTAGDAAAATAHLSQLRTLLGNRDLQQPRLSAQADYLLALAAASGGASLGDGSGQVDEPLARVFAFATSGGVPLRRGAVARRAGGTAASTPRLFQLAFVTADARNRGLAGRAVEARLTGYVNEPPIGVWRNDPVDALAFVAFDRSGLAAGQFGAAIKRGSPEQLLPQVDAVLRSRFLTGLPLGGRIQQIRSTVGTNRSLISPAAAAWVDNPPPRLRAMSEILALPAAPPATAEAIARARQLESLATTLALSRVSVPSTAPRPLVDSQDLSQLPAGHGLLAFVDIGSGIVCVLSSGQKLEVWTAPASRMVANDVAKVLRGIGVGNRKSTAGGESGDSWKADAAALRQKLIPNDKLELVESLKQLTIVPDGPLWYLPFELLPIGAADALLWGDQTAIRYAPTPGLAIYPTGFSRPDLAVGTAAQLFFAPRDRELNAQLVLKVTEAIQGHQALVSPTWTSSYRLGDSIGFMAALGAITPDIAAPLATGVSLFDTNPATGSLAAWMRLGSAPPAGVFLPGYRTAVAANQLGTGRELFMTVTALHLAGVRDIVISRWPVGGESTAILTREFLQELPFDGLEPSWRRALRTLRGAQLDPAQEPLLSGLDAKVAEASGDLPLFWAGYLMSSPPGPNAAVQAAANAVAGAVPPPAAKPPVAGAANDQGAAPPANPAAVVAAPPAGAEPEPAAANAAAADEPNDAAVPDAEPDAESDAEPDVDSDRESATQVD